MSINFDDYINGQLAIQDDNNRKLTQARVQLGEAALIFGINFLEATGIINGSTARMIRSSVTLIENIGKWFKWF